MSRGKLGNSEKGPVKVCQISSYTFYYACERKFIFLDMHIHYLKTGTSDLAQSKSD